MDELRAFKVGDIVEIINNRMCVPSGHRGRITKIEDSHAFVKFFMTFGYLGMLRKMLIFPIGIKDDIIIKVINLNSEEELEW